MWQRCLPLTKWVYKPKPWGIALVNPITGRLHRSLKGEGLKARLLLQVHDELLLKAPPEEVERASVLLKDAMEGADDLGPLGVRLAAEVRSGKSWLACK